MKKYFVITGGTSGVGLAVAKDLIKYDVNLILIGRNFAKGKIIEQKLGNKVKFIQCDLTNLTEIKITIDKISKITNKLEGLVLCHGIFPNTSQENIKVNLLSHYYFTHELKNLLVNAKILLVTGKPNSIKFLPIWERQTTKLERMAWVVTHKTLLMKYLSNEFKKYQTTVNSFFPGDIRSNLMDYTKNLTNTEVLVASTLLLDERYNAKTDNFYNEFAKPVILPNKYSNNNEIDKLNNYIN